MRSDIVKLEVAAANIVHPGWFTVDAAKAVNPDMVQDVRKGIPIADSSVSFVYHEHFIEHLTRVEAVAFCKEILRLLKPGGVHRLATLCLEYVTGKYASEDWAAQEWIERYGYHKTVDTRGKMINAIFHNWGHKFIFDEEELRLVLKEAGYSSVTRREFGESSREELRGMEHRQDSMLILEGTK